jgi:hypothetical protein
VIVRCAQGKISLRVVLCGVPAKLRFRNVGAAMRVSHDIVLICRFGSGLLWLFGGGKLDCRQRPADAGLKPALQGARLTRAATKICNGAGLRTRRFILTSARNWC